MTILIASDHNGIALKKLMSEQHERWASLNHIDLGPWDAQTSVDYTDIAKQAATIVASKQAKFAVLICGTGTGMAITANKTSQARAAVCHSVPAAQKAREHNDSNILCLSSWLCTPEENIEIAFNFFSTPFGYSRHVRRVEKISPTRTSKLVFANGVFDILHQGHVQMLQWAAGLGDRLIVAINSDASTRRLKGCSRPINSAKDRKAVLDAMRFVDETIVFEEDSPINLINALKPNILVKGGEWLADEVRARDLIPENVEIKIFPLISGYSTSKVIEKIVVNQKE